MGFQNDPDSRVRLEVVKGLEKKKGARANQILKELLKDKEEEIRKKALNLISLSDDKEFVPGLKEVFFTGLLDRKKVLAAVFKLGEEACREFALKMVTDETFFPGNFSRREKGELQLEALSLIEKNADDRIFQTLESCLRKRKKGFLGILHRDEVTEKIAKILSLKDKKIGIPRL